MSLWSTYKRSLGYLAEEKLSTALICAANVVLAVVTIAEPLLLGRVIDTISDKGNMFSALGIWSAVGLFNIVAFIMVSREADRLAHRRKLAVLTQSYNHIITMPLAWHHQRGTSNALHTLIRAVETLFALWLEFMRQHLATATALVFLFPVAAIQDWRLCLVLVVLGALYIVVGRMVMEKTQDGQSKVEKHHLSVFGQVSDSISNVSVLQSYNRIEEETRALQSYTKQLLDAQYPVLNWWALASGIHRMASTVSMVVILFIGSILVAQGEMRVGEIVAFTGFASLLISRLDQISAFTNQIFAAQAKLEDFFEMETSVDAVREAADALDFDALEGHVVFDDVSYQFPNSTQGLFNVSFEARPGDTVAIVGPTGAGKTTLVNVLQRVYDPNGGRVLLDGVDTRTISRRSLRNAIATVFQDAGMFNRSIGDNIKIGRLHASMDDVKEAALAADANEFILSKSSGYDTVVGERGSQLSGGERQRLAIARAILKNAPILVLDEATSALDVETEARVKIAIDKLRANRTTFVIAHRLSTVRNADVVLFMDRGRLVESGTYDELARANGRFAALLRAGGLGVEDENSPPRLHLETRQEQAVAA